jgi:hypothetical protein
MTDGESRSPPRVNSVCGLATRSRGLVGLMTTRKQVVVTTVVALRHELECAMAMLGVVPGDELLDPIASIAEVGESVLRVLWTLFQRAKQRLGKWFVVTDRGATKRRHYTQCL